MTTALALALLAGALAWPVPLALAAARWPARCPHAAVVLWQAVGLTGGLAGVGACFALGVAPLSPHLLGGLLEHAGNVAGGHPLRDLSWANLLGLFAGVVLTTRLLSVLAVSSHQVVRDRRRQRHIVDLAARVPDGPYRQHLRVLDHPLAVAYCVPGVRPRVVVSRGALATLAADELAAVLAHERAHVRGRHDLVVRPFAAWEATFPFLRPARAATAAVSLLVEMLADDVAARRTSPRSLARALVQLVVGRVPAGALGAARSPVVARVGRLIEPPLPPPWWLPTAAYAVAGALVFLPGALLLRV